MKLAIIKTGGKQYVTRENETIEVEKIPGSVGQKVIFDKVLAIVDQNQVNLGQPLIDDSQVTGEITKQFKGEKIRIAKFRAKSRYRRLAGHRQEKTLVKIKKILQKISGKKLAAN